MPLTDMTATDRYKSQDGGFCGGGKNVPPEAHQSAARAQTAKIVPLDAEGTLLVIALSAPDALFPVAISHLQRASPAPVANVLPFPGNAGGVTTSS